MHSTISDKKYIKFLAVVFWLIIWQILSVIINNQILIAGPYETAIKLISLMGSGEYWTTVLLTSAKIIGGFSIGLISGILVSLLAYKSKIFEVLLSPFTYTIKSIPVASFVIIVLIWVGSSNLSLVISSLVVFPIVYKNTLEGLKAIDIKLIEMANIYKVKPLTKFKEIYLRSLKPFLISSISLASGMSYKSGIAAEVIGRPLHTIGINIYNSKVYLDTSALFAWTVTAVLLSIAFEKVMNLILRRVFNYEN